MTSYSKPLSHILITIIIFVSIASGFFVMFTGLNEQYSSNLPTEELEAINSTFGNLSQTSQYLRTESSKDRFVSSIPLVGLVIEGLGDMFSYISGTLTVIPAILKTVKESLFLPDWFYYMIGAMFLIILSASLFRIIFGQGREI